MKKIFLLLFFFQFQFSLFSQTTQDILMRIFPDNAFLKIDNQLIVVADQSVPFILNLEQGRYPLEIWASQYKIFRDTLVVSEKTKSYTKKLTERTHSFIDFEKEKKANTKIRILRIGATVGLIAVNVSGFYLSLNNNHKIDELEAEATRLRVLHQNLALPGSFENNRIAYDAVLEEYDKERKRVYLKRSIGIPLSCLSTFISQKLIRKIWSKKLSKPILEEDKNPFVFNSLELNSLDASYQFTLSFKF